MWHSEKIRPQAYRGHRLNTSLYQPPRTEVIHLDTTSTPPAVNPAPILGELGDRGFAGHN